MHLLYLTLIIALAINIDYKHTQGIVIIQGTITITTYVLSVHQIDRQLIPLLSLPQIDRWTTHTSHMGSYLSIYVFQYVQMYNAFCMLSL